jgi:hypothetical protein
VSWVAISSLAIARLPEQRKGLTDEERLWHALLAGVKRPEVRFLAGKRSIPAEVGLRLTGPEEGQ